MEALARWSTNMLLRCQAIDEDDREVYEYGFEMIFANIIDVLSIAVIALLLHRVPEVLVYHIAFVPLRQCAGGVHARTRLRCFIASTLMLLASLGAVELTAAIPWATCGMAALAAAVVWALAPSEHENAPMGAAKRVRMKRMSRVLATLMLCATASLYLLGDAEACGWAAACIATGMACTSGMLLAARLHT